LVRNAEDLVRKNKVLLSSLSVGRCFTLPTEPGAEKEEGDATKARIATSVLAPADAWKITDLSDESATCASASGEEKAFPTSTEVVEIPRQGYETLAAR
jgi:hypothetical protein